MRNNIKILSESIGYSYVDLARLVGVSYPCAYRWFTNFCNPRVIYVSRLCKVLSCSPEDLFTN